MEQWTVDKSCMCWFQSEYKFSARRSYVKCVNKKRRRITKINNDWKPWVNLHTASYNRLWSYVSDPMTTNIASLTTIIYALVFSSLAGVNFKCNQNFIKQLSRTAGYHANAHESKFPAIICLSVWQRASLHKITRAEKRNADRKKKDVVQWIKCGSQLCNCVSVLYKVLVRELKFPTASQRKNSRGAMNVLLFVSLLEMKFSP